MQNEKSELIEIDFATWVNDHTDKLYGWAFYKTSNKEVAEDLVQDTFYSAFKSLDRFEKKSNPLTWLTAILNNKIIDYYKSNLKNSVSLEHEESKRASAVSDVVFDDEGIWNLKENLCEWTNHENLLDNPEFVDTLENCYNHLPAFWKQAIQAKYIFNINSSDICQELDITPSNYWKIIQRSKLILKRCLESNWFNQKVR